MRVIIDTNILISAAVADGKPEKVINFIISHADYDWIVSQEILDEYREVLQRKKLKLRDTKKAEWLTLIENSTKLIEVNVNVDFTRDPKDAKVIALARVSEADFLITGDRDFEEMIELEQTVIISVSLFYDLFIGEGEYE
ncbi:MULTISPECIES: putative toxin-antitoxin system toxin component, PIN family [unclassified Microcystis]|uniref:putative toxin-antitoxin system toxin component, PIN family n=1 Tax=unclassified Microcystis TaxID=2643300 RepID=UPI0022BF285B|nr:MULTISPECIES: putative toxin-antitoxin system toxin component, PIN family [unclassified Microcystis]MCA2694202.1 putative toxin-antitoxin system toxin component, PIN family [Microcystis sp. M034S2]MCA2751828.1 putative toxin-antitoxin system toxin component, PIN family [Microcystis sp. M144S2]MCZ8202401.1 putative toxin-antitoxin system toxin component, PIN family [Microcystis sp. LE19-55.1A]MCZ8307802.1 putative toxin-antitoxin system toxin component, PIN family [Microcystis sp. LE19-98.1E]